MAQSERVQFMYTKLFAITYSQCKSFFFFFFRGTTCICSTAFGICLMNLCFVCIFLGSMATDKDTLSTVPIASNRGWICIAVNILRPNMLKGIFATTTTTCDCHCCSNFIFSGPWWNKVNFGLCSTLGSSLNDAN